MSGQWTRCLSSFRVRPQLPEIIEHYAGLEPFSVTYWGECWKPSLGYFNLDLNQDKGLSQGTDEGRLPLLLLLASNLGPSWPSLLVPCHPVPVSLPCAVTYTSLVNALMCHLEVLFPWSALTIL